MEATTNKLSLFKIAPLLWSSSYMGKSLANATHRLLRPLLPFKKVAYENHFNIHRNTRRY